MTTKPDDFADVLETLADSDGAILYWQTPKDRFEAAYNAGAIKRVGELFVHPDAITIEPGGAYTMPDTIESLCEDYAFFNERNRLNLGSADEHWYDETLTQEQRDWVREFSKRWDAAAARERESGK